MSSPDDQRSDPLWSEATRHIDDERRSDAYPEVAVTIPATAIERPMTESSGVDPAPPLVVAPGPMHAAGVVERGASTSRGRLAMEGLVDQAKGGDQRAFEEIVRRTYADTYTLAFRLTGDEEDASDVVQETYLRVHKGIARFRGDAQFTTWLHRVTANCASTFLGRRGKHRHDPLPDDPSIVDEHPRHDPALRADVGQLRSQLTDALRALPPKLRAVIVLRDIYDLPHEAIAAELGITESAAKVRLHRARKRLRERLYPLRGDSSEVEAQPVEAGTSDQDSLATVTSLVDPPQPEDSKPDGPR